MKRTLPRVSALALLPFVLAAITGHCLAQEARPAKEPAGQISGRVSVGGKAARGIQVVLTTAEPGPRREAVARDKTDEGGHYKLTGIPPGQYNVLPIAPAYTIPTQGPFGQQGRVITIGDGESIEGFDFSLARGGVITGQLTDAEGQPMVAERINLSRLTEQNQERPVYMLNHFMLETDDRGIYRVYGLPAGRYLVSAGVDPNGRGMAVMGGRENVYTRTYHPDTTDKARARVVELEAGGEATGVDIRLGGTLKGYTVSGRIVFADTGKPVVGVAFGYGPVDESGTRLMGYAWGDRTNGRGEFHLEGVIQGRYLAFATFEGDSDYFCDGVAFQVADENVSGLEVKVRRGASISGTVVLEGRGDADALAKLSQLHLGFSSPQQEMSAPGMDRARVGPDGSFRIRGLPPGKGKIMLASYPPVKGFALIRVERDGVEQAGGIEVAAGEQVSGVRVFLAYGTGSIRGQVKVEGGPLPEGSRMYVIVTPVTAGRAEEVAPAGVRPGEVDSRGSFVIEGLAAGEYQVVVNAFMPSRNRASLPKASQSVNVTDGAEARVTVTLDLTEKNKDKDKDQ
jgi:hypothetical protein